MQPILRRAALAVALMLTLQTSARGDVPDVTRSVGLSPRLGAMLPLDLPFTDEQGHRMELRRCFGERPVVLLFGWYQCPMLCPEAENGVVQCLLDLPERAGRDMDVLMVSIDPEHTPALAAGRLAVCVQRYGRGGAGWHFLTGPKSSIEALTKAAGYRYVYDVQAKQYAHPSGLYVLSPRGRVVQCLYGVRFSSGQLKQALADARAETPEAAVVNPLALLCYQYDPATGRWGLAVMRLVRLGGVVTLAGLVWFVARGDGLRRRVDPNVGPKDAGGTS